VAWVNLPNPNYEVEKENTETYTFIVCSRQHSREDLRIHLEDYEQPQHTVARKAALDEELAMGPGKTDDELYEDYLQEEALKTEEAGITA